MTRLNQSRRGLIGYVYHPQVNNNIGLVQGSTSYKSRIIEETDPVYQTSLENDNLEGDGFADKIKEIYHKGKKLVQKITPYAEKASDFYKSETGTALRNLIPDSDDTARPGFAGEQHAILQLPNGKNGVANYMGPGTNVIKRLERGDPGRTKSDMVAKRHDIDYMIAQNARTKADQLQQVRAADNRMINSLKKIQANKGDAGRNIQMGMRLIQAKKLGEDLGKLDKSEYAGELEKISPGDMALLMKNKGELQQQGFGKNTLLPGNKLKNKLLNKMIKEQKMKSLGDRVKTQKLKGAGKVMPHTSSGQSRSKTLPDSKGYKISGEIISKANKLNPRPIRFSIIGKGVKGFSTRKSAPLSGKGVGIKEILSDKSGIVDFVMKKILPSLTEATGLKSLPIAKITPIIKKAIETAKTGNLPEIIKNLTKSILPILGHSKLKQIGMSGTGAVDFIKEASSKLNEKLARALFGAFKAYINQGAKDRGLSPIFKGSGLNPAGSGLVAKSNARGDGLNPAGGGFWSDFAKGFTSVFKPAAKVLSVVADVAGVPEIGLPLGAIADVL